MTRIAIYDTTLRDGSQGEGVNFSLQDKLRIAERLDELGVDYIEGGYPLSNPKDEAFFRAARDLDLRHSRIAAFGMTRRRDSAAEDDTGMLALVRSGASVVTVVGKSWDFQALEVLGVSLEENRRMIADSVAFCASRVAEVVYDAEHFFDGFRHNPEYALKTLEAAVAGGAAWLILCDTNGGTLPEGIAAAVAEVRRNFSGARRHPHPTTTANSPWPTPWRQSAWGPRRSRGQLTGSANVAAMSTSAAWWQTWR